MEPIYYTEKEVEQIVQEQMAECLEIWDEKIYERKSFSKLCEFHAILTENPKKDHNCIGCNLADTTNLILDYLRNSQNATTYEYAYNMLIISFYLLVERIDTILKIVEIRANNLYFVLT